MRSLLVLVALILGSSSAAYGQSQLSIAGQPYFGGSVTLSVTAPSDTGKPVLLAYGLDPLPPVAPAHCSKGPFFIGSFVHVLGLGSVGSNGRFDMPFGMPAYSPALDGIPVALQAYVAGNASLSNPATLPLDVPYLVSTAGQVIWAPIPATGAQFGYIVATGDFNSDGITDIASSAAYESYLGKTWAGRVYVLWGPTYSAGMMLSSPSPRAAGFFGVSLTVADVNGDLTDDLIAGETAGSPQLAGVTPNLHVFLGGLPFPAPGSFVVSGPGWGPQYSGYGYTVAAGDFNNDGNVDLAVGNNKAPVQGLSEVGQVDLYMGPSYTTMQVIPSPEVEEDLAFGSWLTSADFNDDGISDLLETSGTDDIGGVMDIGSAHIFLGPSMSLATTIPCPLPDGAGTGMGSAASTAGDINGDGLPEVIASDYHDRVFVFLSPNYASYRVIKKPPVAVPNPFGETAFGWSLGVGDVNLDGVGDLLIGDWFEGELAGCPASSEGTVFAALGPYLQTFHRIQDKTQNCGDMFGRSFVLKDLEGDGQAELVVGVILADDNNKVGSGHVTVLRAAQP